MYVYIHMYIRIYIYTHLSIYGGFLKGGVPPVIIQVMDYDLVKQPTVDLWCRS